MNRRGISEDSEFRWQGGGYSFSPLPPPPRCPACTRLFSTQTHNIEHTQPPPNTHTVMPSHTSRQSQPHHPPHFTTHPTSPPHSHSLHTGVGVSTSLSLPFLFLSLSLPLSCF